MNNSKICGLLLVLACLCFSTGAYAKAKPRWVSKGIKELNAQRTNDTYTFHVLNSENGDDGVLVLDRFIPLEEYVESVYDVPRSTMTLDSIPGVNGQRTTYTISFDNNGSREVVYAQRVDDYTQLEDFVDNSFIYHFYQLYAISNPGVTAPQFDDFSISRYYNAGVATALSIIPGMGQIYKKQNLKGWIFFATDIALFGTLVFSEIERHHYQNKRTTDKNPNWHNEITTFKELSLFTAIGGVALWVYNIFDAAFCPIAPRVEVHRPNSPAIQMSFNPYIAPDYFGGGMNVGLGFQMNF